MAERRMLLHSTETFVGTMRIDYQSYHFNLNINNNIKIIEHNYNNGEGYFIIGFKYELIVPENFISERVDNLAIYNTSDDYIIFNTNSIAAINIDLHGNFKFTYKCINSYTIHLYDYNYIYNNECFITDNNSDILFHGNRIPQYYENTNNCFIYAYSHILYDLMKYNNIEEGDEEALKYKILDNTKLIISSSTGYGVGVPNVDLGNNNYIKSINSYRYNGTHITEYICNTHITHLRKGISLPLDSTVYFPDTVTDIDGDTFQNESNLKKVVIFGNCVLTYLDAFFNSNLENIEIYSDEITDIRIQCFYGSNLKSLYIPKSVSNIEGDILSNCENIESIIINENNSNYDSRNNCNAIINNGILIQGCKNTIIPNDINIIGAFAFDGMGLKEIIIPNNITTLHQRAFINNPIDNIIIPESVIDISVNCFDGTNIYKNENNWINGILYISNCIVFVKQNISGEITILDNTRLICESAFESLSNITKINIPNSLKYINYRGFAYMGNLTIEYDGTENEWNNNIIKSNAWDQNTNITYIFKEAPLNEIYYTSTDGNIINVDPSYTNNELLSNTYEDKGKLVFKNVINSIDYLFKDNTQLEEVWLPDYDIPNTISAFEGCTNLIRVNNSKRLLMGAYIFRYCENLNRIEIDSSLIGDRAFVGCTLLNYVKISKRVETIDQVAFGNCTSLQAIDYEGTIEEWNNININGMWNYGSTITTIHCTDGDIQL